jgi:hypothetical protein
MCAGSGENQATDEEEPMTVSLAARRRATRFYSRFHKLHTALADVISSYSLVSFQTLAIEVRIDCNCGGACFVSHAVAALQDRESLETLIAVIDKANSFVQHTT